MLVDWLQFKYILCLAGFLPPFFYAAEIYLDSIFLSTEYQITLK